MFFKKIISLLSSFVLLCFTTSAVSADQTDHGALATEKCYGIAKAGQNDCHTATTTCSGSAKIDGQKDAWIGLPQGICQRIVGGSKTSA